MDVTTAISHAFDAFNDIYKEANFDDILVEEVELDEGAGEWCVTIGFVNLGERRGPISSLQPPQRSFKQFRIDAETGKMISMKIRTP